MGVTTEYIQWDNNREWIRKKPKFAITLPKSDKRIFDQYNSDSFIGAYYKGKIALVNGIRASESLIRYRASVNKLNENYINSVPDQRIKNVKLVKPLFDWEEDDVFKYFYEKKIPYCNLYDWQMFSGQALRVSTPCHAESAKKFYKLREIDPVLYEQVVSIFPDMTVQERYFKEYDTGAIIKENCTSLRSIAKWITDNITEPNEFALAKKRFNSVASRYRKFPESYPLEHILRQFVNGAYKREVVPKGKTK